MRRHIPPPSTTASSLGLFGFTDRYRTQLAPPPNEREVLLQSPDDYSLRTAVGIHFERTGVPVYCFTERTNHDQEQRGRYLNARPVRYGILAIPGEHPLRLSNVIPALKNHDNGKGRAGDINVTTPAVLACAISRLFTVDTFRGNVLFCSIQSSPGTLVRCLERYVNISANRKC